MNEEVKSAGFTRLSNGGVVTDAEGRRDLEGARRVLAFLVVDYGSMRDDLRACGSRLLKYAERDWLAVARVQEMVDATISREAEARKSEDAGE